MMTNFQKQLLLMLIDRRLAELDFMAMHSGATAVISKLIDDEISQLFLTKRALTEYHVTG
jgi:hypothetical protein